MPRSSHLPRDQILPEQCLAHTVNVEGALVSCLAGRRDERI